MRGIFVTATDTEAGKTFVSAALSRLLRALVVKPVQTGCIRKKDGLAAPDVEFVNSFGGQALALHAYEPPCSPHLAAGLAGERLDCAVLAREVLAAGREHAADTLVVEGAGGVYVPLNGQEDMIDLMIRLDLPVLLVVANRLGCLNQARLSLEALQARGLAVLGMVLNRTVPEGTCDPGCGSGAGDKDEERILRDNVLSLQALGERLGAPLLASLPYFGENPGTAREGILQALSSLAKAVARTLDRRESCGEEIARDLIFDKNHLWHPYTSATRPLPVYPVARTRDNRIVLADGRELVDGMSSWWCAVHGYGNERIVRDMTAQLNTMSHVMFGGLVHRPAVTLAKKLLGLVPAGLNSIFYADSGSVAVEVALKMAVQYQISLGRKSRKHFLTPMGGYHGDTQGAMSVCDPVNGMHTLFTGLLPRHYFVERPTCRFDAPFDTGCLDDARRHLEALQDEIAAVILEPVVQGAGGMWFYHPDYLKGLKALCERYDILLVADEIATGFGRTGRLFACQWAGITPDIMCLGKALTGGMMTGAATLATDRVAQGIGQAPAELGAGILMHGPTFMANPLFCTAACASIDELLSSPWQDRVHMLQETLEAGLAPCRGKAGVRDVRVLGAIGVVETERAVNMERLQAFFVEQGVWIRPFGHLVYLMPPFTTPREDAEKLCRAVTRAVDTGLV